MATIVCPTCSAQYRIRDDKITDKSRLRCKKCGTVFRLQDTIQEAGESLPLELAPPEAQGSRQLNEPQTSVEPHLPTLEFDLSAAPQTPAASPEAPESSESDAALNLNLGDMTLDFDSSSEEPDTSLSFGAEEDNSIEEELHDHITDIKLDSPSTDFADFSFEGQDNDSGETAPSLDDSLDFSFSANIPEEVPEDEGFEDNEEEASQESSEDQEIGLSLDDLEIGTNVAEETLTIEQKLEVPASLDMTASDTEETMDVEPPVEDGQEAEFFAEDLSTCCIDSLSMGRLRCEICGRDLKNYQKYANELQLQRRQQLKDELIQAETQIGFSEEQLDTEHGAVIEKSSEDFTDVERALDALADGSFQDTIKKKEAKKSRRKTLKSLAALVMIALIVVLVVFVFLLPSSHEKLLERYDTLMAQQPLDSANFVRLFLDAIIEKDTEIFQKLSVMRIMPEINSGKIIGVSEQEEIISIGNPGQKMSTLKNEIAAFEEQIREKTKTLDEVSSKTFSPSALKQNISSIEGKISALHDEFDAKDASLRKKLLSLQRQLEKTKQKIQENREISRKYLDATDSVGKALYRNSVTKLRSLADLGARLETQIQQERIAYQQHKDGLDTEYEPIFSELEKNLRSEKALLDKAYLLQDAERSPVVILSKELEQMTKAIIEKKNELEQTESQLKNVYIFFRDPTIKNRVVKQQQNAEFSHTSKNVAVVLKIGKSSEQQVSIVLKRYDVRVAAGTTLHSNWLVEKIAK